MVRRSLRSTSVRKIPVRTPGSRVVTHYKYRKPGKASCAGCGKDLKGVPHERPFKMATMAKSKKRPERPFGGVLCSACMRKVMVEKARKE